MENDFQKKIFGDFVKKMEVLSTDERRLLKGGFCNLKIIENESLCAPSANGSKCVCIKVRL